MNLTGQKYGKLYVVEKTKEKTKKGDYKYRCICDCGNEVLVVGANLKNNHSKTCGCSRSTISKGYRNKNIRIYNIYQNMKQRCYDKNAKSYKNYGARGIIVCKEWLEDYELFYNWAINNGYKNNLSIDRVDVNGNYEPSNCRWATREQQANNTRNSRYITYNNCTKTLAEWAKILKMSQQKLRYRIINWDLDKAFNK